MKHSNLHFFLIFGFFVLIFSQGCEKESRHPVPDVYVNFTINLFDDPEYFFLQGQGNLAVIHSEDIGIFSLGYYDNGIIIYNSGGNEFFSFDRTCPYDMPQVVAVEPDRGSSYATCPVCGSVFVFPSMGLPTSDSPSRWPLKRYNTFFNPNNGYLNVSN